MADNTLSADDVVNTVSDANIPGALYFQENKDGGVSYDVAKIVDNAKLSVRNLDFFYDNLKIL